MRPDVRELCDAIRPPDLPLGAVAEKETLAVLTIKIRELERQLADERMRYRKLEQDHHQKIRALAGEWAARLSGQRAKKWSRG